MKKHIAMKWIKALRGQSKDGVYEQGTRQLVDDKDRFCCLGVLCNIHNKHDWVYVDNAGNWTYCKAYGSLPDEVKEWAGLSSATGGLPISVTVDDGVIVDSLTALNDFGSSFEEIASIIEKHWEEL